MDPTAVAVTVVVGIGAALIGAVAALGGVFFGSRWQARSTLEQWRRDRLLQFCADLLAAGQETHEYSRRVRAQKIGPPFEGDPSDRLDHPVACVALLNPVLGGSAVQYYNAIIECYQDALEEAKNAIANGVPPGAVALRPTDLKTAQERGIFIRTAHGRLLAVPANPTFWSQVWARLQRTRLWSGTRAEIERAVAPPRTVPAPVPPATAAPPPPPPPPPAAP